jgi:hypothetical protein
MRLKRRCGAYARSTGQPCQAKALANGRCRNHGGLSTGPTSESGRKRIGEAARSRLAAGDQAKLLAGFRAWLDRRRAVSGVVAAS